MEFRQRGDGSIPPSPGDLLQIRKVSWAVEKKVANPFDLAEIPGLSIDPAVFAVIGGDKLGNANVYS